MNFPMNVIQAQLYKLSIVLYVKNIFKFLKVLKIPLNFRNELKNTFTANFE